MDKSYVKQKDKYQENVEDMCNNLICLINKHYPSNLNLIPSIGSLARKYNLNRNTIRKYILISLKKETSHENAYKIYSDIWNRNIKKIQERHSKFLNLIEYQFEKIYYGNPEKIMGINSIQKEIGASKITIIKWCKSYLNSRFGEKESNHIYEKIWGSNCALKNKYDYDTIKKFMIDQKGYLLTTREEWKMMEEVPSERYIEVGHPTRNSHHNWSVKVRYLINQSRWCPKCNDYFCQKIMQMYMNKILGGDFRPITLKKAFGLEIRDGGLLKYDSYNEKVEIEGNIFKVAAEYDGKQHDLFPNNFHESKEEYRIQKRRDNLKDNISNQKYVVLIRIKAVNGFHRNTINSFQEEITKQINSHPIIRKSEVKINNIPKYVYNPFLKKLEKQESIMDFLR